MDPGELKINHEKLDGFREEKATSDTEGGEAFRRVPRNQIYK